ncbi:hypothetical protein BDV25DRAFT_136987 [Aspergillus avenaceus]|uniref:Uncharacterized protein n=1 Tax=Aspergillus avenaceus TaxID=36643 RepID=A0A5N6U424_ASPAV|nr:hypothetical protein BDV25DRAFT_136987 [Aspergillus avenaceus]
MYRFIILLTLYISLVAAGKSASKIAEPKTPKPLRDNCKDISVYEWRPNANQGPIPMLKASCKQPNGNLKESTVDLDNCLGFDRFKGTIIRNVQEALSLGKWCRPCLYNKEWVGSELRCSCDTKSKQEYPMIAKFDLEAVLGFDKGKLYCLHRGPNSNNGVLKKQNTDFDSKGGKDQGSKSSKNVNFGEVTYEPDGNTQGNNQESGQGNTQTNSKANGQANNKGSNQANNQAH